MCHRPISSLVVEEMFNRVKKAVDLSANTQCSPQRAFAETYDGKVMTKIHKYEEVPWRDEVRERNFKLDGKEFRPPMRLDKIEPETKALGLYKV